MPNPADDMAFDETIGATRPKVVCLCGSIRWPSLFEVANMHASLQGRIVIGLGMFGHADRSPGARFLTNDGDETDPRKSMLDQLHFRKIDLADEILVINPGGYIQTDDGARIDFDGNGYDTRSAIYPASVSPKVAVRGSTIAVAWQDNQGDSNSIDAAVA